MDQLAVHDQEAASAAVLAEVGRVRGVGARSPEFPYRDSLQTAGVCGEEQRTGLLLKPRRKRHRDNALGRAFLARLECMEII